MANSSKRLFRIKIYRFFIFAILFITAASVIVSFLEKKYSTVAGSPSLTKSEIKNFRYKKIKNGKILYRIAAPTVKIKGNRYILKNPRIVYFSKKRKYKMRSEKAVYYRNGNMEASGKIKIKTSDGYLISTEYLKYNGKTRKIVAPKKITLIGNKIKGSGKDATIDISRGILIVNKNVKIKLKEIR